MIASGGCAVFRVVVRVGLFWVVSLLVAFASMEGLHRILVASGRVVDPDGEAPVPADVVVTNATAAPVRHAGR